MSDPDDRRIMGELLRQLGDALEPPVEFERVRRLIEAAPSRLISFDDEHRRAALFFLESLVTALDRDQARSLSDAGRLQ